MMFNPDDSDPPKKKRRRQALSCTGACIISEWCRRTKTDGR